MNYFHGVEARERASESGCPRLYEISTHGFVKIIYGIIRGCALVFFSFAT